MAEVPDEKLDAIGKAIKHSRWAPGVVAYLVLALLNAIAIGGLIWLQYEAREQRKEALRGTCLQQAAQAERNVESQVASAQVFIDTAEAGRARRGEPPTDPVDIKNYLEGQTAAAQRVNPIRDCSEAGIAAYNAHPPAPSACRPDGQGFCKP